MDLSLILTCLAQNFANVKQDLNLARKTLKILRPSLTARCQDLSYGSIANPYLLGVKLGKREARSKILPPLACSLV